jgi:uncharacterized protein (UPF0335 family)
MALKKETIEKIKAFGFDVDKLIAAVKADAETDYEVPEDVTVIKNTDLEARDTNKLAEGKRAGESEGEKKGRELAAKAFRKKFSLDDAIGNDVDKVVTAVNEKLNKGDAGLQEQITLLQKDKETLAAEKAQLEAKAKQAGFDAELISYFPSNRTSDLNDAERLALVKMNLSFEELDGKTVVKKNGEILRDKQSQAPVAVKDAIATVFTEKKWVGAQGGGNGGRGGNDQTGGSGAGNSGIKTASKFTEKWKAENPGKTELSTEYVDALNKHAKEVADFDMYN